mmetsp:Transcript_47015/g.135919  ORF Transcript_47015/g.135919 Transcript_47015/m.135919 type:complete len:129 (+) Transcript_47015:187-573(+)
MQELRIFFWALCVRCTRGQPVVIHIVLGPRGVEVGGAGLVPPFETMNGTHFAPCRSSVAGVPSALNQMHGQSLWAQPVKNTPSQNLKQGLSVSILSAFAVSALHLPYDEAPTMVVGKVCKLTRIRGHG